jgi:hypothetical protein
MISGPSKFYNQGILSFLFFASLFFFLPKDTGTAYAQAPEYKWAIQGFGTGDDRGIKIVGVDDGNVIVTGRYHSKELRFGEITLTNANPDSGSDAFIVKVNPDAKVLWAKNLGGQADETGNDFAMDAKGNIVFVGCYDSEEITIGNQLFKNKTARGAGSDVLIVKYSTDGDVIWARSIGGTKHDGGRVTCAIDKEQNIYLTGQFYSASFRIDSFELVNSKERGADVFLAKFSPEGKLQWVKSSRGPNGADCATESCAIDNLGNIVISGWFAGSYLVFAGDTLRKNAAKNNGIFVSKYSPSGNLIWANNYGGAVATSRVDKEGNIFLAGLFDDSLLTIGNETLYNKGDADILVVKLNPKGKVIWARSAGGKEMEGIRNFCLDAKGNAIVTGSFVSQDWKLGDQTLAKNNTTVTNKKEERTEDMFIAAYSKNGDVLWAKYAGGMGRNAGRSCVSDKHGNIYLTGSFDARELKLGSLTLTNSGDCDVFIVKLSPKR